MVSKIFVRFDQIEIKHLLHLPLYCTVVAHTHLYNAHFLLFVFIFVILYLFSVVSGFERISLPRTLKLTSNTFLLLWLSLILCGFFFKKQSRWVRSRVCAINGVFPVTFSDVFCAVLKYLFTFQQLKYFAWHFYSIPTMVKTKLSAPQFFPMHNWN